MIRSARLIDVAEAAGVSKATASNVFNRPEIVREEARARVLAAAKALGYTGPDPRGRMLSAGRVNAIGVATAEPLAYFFEDPYARRMMMGITEVCDAEGIGVSLISAATEDDFVWNIRNAVVDGLVLFCLDDAERLIAASRERNLPFVALSFAEANETAPMVGIDDAAGARLAAEHLLALGHRRFGVLAMEFADGGEGLATPERIEAARYLSSRDRARGYLEVLARAGIAPGTVPVYETRPEAEAVARGLETLFAAPEPPTAIFAQSDRIALEALDWLAARGIAVPEAVSVIGFDGVPEGALSRPPLTTIRQPILEIGRRAARLILDHPGEPRRETLALDLIARGSTAAAPG
ncbi:MAG: LacI family transcriptional regulator [Rhodovulum sulfidophilum]|uniref:LacI family transcriptional regulator n=1 Tax=Rhodovulum sulfidophilum TaxID=35806 RepID=A0A2W5Q9A3_RHOSU|nr:MAG: LacI family transcriptional regulator [Rhodovulum sulfidophilum]